MWETGWWLSGFDLIARVLPAAGPAVYMAKFDKQPGLEILWTTDPDQPSDDWQFGGVITPEMRFPYGWNVYPD